MAIVESVSRLAGTFIAILQTRVELLGVEVEEELWRVFSYFFLALASMLCFGMALLLTVLLVMVLYWDTQRLPALISLMGLFTLSGVAILFAIRKRYRLKPRIFSHTVKELSRDIERLQTRKEERCS